MISLPLLQQRSQLLQAVRAFFLAHHYLEVDTPIRLPLVIPEAYISPFSCESHYLHTSPELCMKLLLGAGATRLFQLCHCFRKDEQGRLHQNEFTMLEWYHVGWNYRDLMAQCEELLAALLAQVAGLAAVDESGMLHRAGRTISLQAPWQRLSVDYCFRHYAGLSAHEALAQGRFDEILVTLVEPHLGWDRPVFLYDYPAQLGALARRKPEDQALAERFELYIAGIELANGFSELIDPREQRRRFEKEIEIINKNQAFLAMMPEELLHALGNMSETAGIALGFDRLLMLLVGAESITEVVTISFSI